MNEESRILRHLIKMSNNSKINKHTGKKCRSRRTIKGLKRERRRRKERRKEGKHREGRKGGQQLSQNIEEIWKF